MLMPTIPLDKELKFSFFNFFLTKVVPLLLNPKWFIIALSSLRRKTLGFSFPYWYFGVTVPASINPKPRLSKGLITSAFLSNPAAKPKGLLKSNRKGVGAK